jgi:hypothetical protein
VVTEGGKNADQKIARYVLKAAVQDGCHPVREAPARFAISAWVIFCRGAFVQ